MIAFFFVSGNGSTREEVSRARSLVRLRVKSIKKRKKKNLTIGQEMWFGKNLRITKTTSS